MTASIEYTGANALTRVPVRIADGGRMLVRVAQKLFGVSLTLAALALWLAPGASWEHDVMLFKLILSIAAGIAGAGLMLASAAPAAPQAEIDTIRREVRLLRVGRDGSAVVLQRCSFADLTRAERCGAHLRLWGYDGVLLAEVTLSNRSALRRLVAGLQDAGKLA